MSPPSSLDAQTIATIHRVATRHKATSVRVYGSRARGDNRADSDLDLLVEFEPGATLFELIGIEQDLADQLGYPVSVATEAGLSHRLRPRILAEAVEV